MTESSGKSKSLHASIGTLAISAGSFLLAINYYSWTTATTVIPSTALGILLLIVAAILAYVGIRKCRTNASLCVLFYWTVSALWFSSGINFILAGNNVFSNTNQNTVSTLSGTNFPLAGNPDMTNANVPGLIAFAVGLFIIGIMGILQNETPLALMAIALSLSSIHETVLLYKVNFGASAIACNYLIVTLIGLYFVAGRVVSILSKGQFNLPGTSLTEKADQEQGTMKGLSRIEFEATYLLLNMVSSSVFACRLLGITNSLFVGQVPWLWTAAVFQTAICILSYRYYNMLDATTVAFFSILRFAEGYSLLYQFFNTGEPNFPLPFLIVFVVLFFILSLFTSLKSLIDSGYLLLFVAYCIALACSPQAFFHGGSQGVNVAIFLFSAILLLIKLYNSKSSAKICIGEGIIEKLFARNSFFKLRQGKSIHEPFLGFSKYADADVLAHACSVLAAFAMTMPGTSSTPLLTVVLPWVVVAGGIYHLICGSVAFSRGKTLESSAFILYGVMWVIWGLTRYGGLYGTSRGFNTAVGIISFLLFNSFIVFSTLFLTKAWFAYSLTFQLILISFLLDSLNALPQGYDIAITIIFGLVSFYCFLATLFNSVFEGPQIPVGSPFIKISGFSNDKSKCPHVVSTRTSSVRQIAEIMKNGGICGIPTDTVYVLVAACNQPDAVEKAYKTKRQAQDRPMSLWISSLEQLASAKHLFSPLLWDFMQKAWPSSISLVIPRGPWLEVLGAKESSKYIGTPQSIAIRIPDCTVTTHLIDMVGPIAVTSANPSGEADTTHHNQVFAKLGDKVNGVLCDGPSPENIASTVVDCTKIDSGNLGFFRVGIVPKSQVLQIFEEVKNRNTFGYENSAFVGSTDQLDNSADNSNPELYAEIEAKETTDQLQNSDGNSNPQPKAYVNGGFALNEKDLKL
uniref:Threonylcarbamoyl-AMP synthase n=1 Tax=Xenopus laevis TaxID=8355 RepID=B7ZQK6_XENLA|nr:Unknown (protein for MGC:196569) [Xenopus laevis]